MKVLELVTVDVAHTTGELWDKFPGGFAQILTDMDDLTGEVHMVFYGKQGRELGHVYLTPEQAEKLGDLLSNPVTLV